MERLTIISALVLSATVAANAGQIQIGGSSGLTDNYVLQGVGAVCAAGAGNCVTGSINGYSEANYDTVLFANATNSGTAPTPFTGYSTPTGTAPGDTLTSNANGTRAGGVSFAMIADGTNGNTSKNFWGSTNTGESDITIPIGIFDVADVAVMLQNEGGEVNMNDTSVKFTFGATPNATSGLTTKTVNLFNVNNSGSGEIRSAVLCNTTQNATCTTADNPATTPALSSTPSGITVTTSTIYTSVYNQDATGYYSNTAGHLKLDDQDFFLGAYSSMYLVSMTVTEWAGGTQDSQTAISAITVDQAPEPGSIVLLLAGIGALGLARRFRRA